MANHGFIGRENVLVQLERIRASDRLEQPFLFVGPDGSGKENTALEFARRLNCAAPASCAVGQRCQSCVKAQGFQHPDIRWLGPAPATVGEDEVRQLLERKIGDPFQTNPWTASAQILIGDPEHPGPLTVRALIRFLRRRAFQGSHKVAVVADAQRLNAAAANALLKTLEEPPPDTVIMLLSTNTEGMLPTILSRCRKLRFDPWPEPELVAMLQRLGGADAERAAAAARLADGNARQALDLLKPEADLLTAWAQLLFTWIHNGQRGQAAIAADELHRGVVSHTSGLAGKAARELEAKAPALRRGRAIQLCERLNVLYSDAVAGRELGQDWRPRVVLDTAQSLAVASRRPTLGLLADIDAIETAKRNIEHNVNVGLTLAVLFEGLIDHARRDQASARNAAG